MNNPFPVRKLANLVLDCFAGVQAVPDGIDLMIFGDIFFKSNFVAFNGGNQSLGVATHA